MKLRIEREVWQGPWNDDTRGPYYKIPCKALHEFEEMVNGKLRDETVLRQSWTNQANAWQEKHGVLSAKIVGLEAKAKSDE